MSRRVARGEPSALVQIPVWGQDAPIEAAAPDEPEGLDALLAGLNPEQRRAVTHADGPLLVVAGAGTGKTQVITRRIAWLIATRRAKPSEILALTFTDQAADEMQMRVDQLVPYGYTDTAISTFHAFGDRLVREFALELGLPPDVRVLSRPGDRRVPARAPVRARARRVPAAGRPDAVPRRARDAVLAREGRGRLAGRLPRPRRPARGPGGRGDGDDRCGGGGGDGGRSRRRRGRSPRTPAARPSSRAPMPATRACSPRTGRSTSGTRSRWPCGCCASRRRPARPSSGGSSTCSWTSSRTPTAPRRSWSRCVAERHRNVTVVGDDDQSIYKFRGAAISNILEFRERYRQARVVVLRRNYRSRGPDPRGRLPAGPPQRPGPARGRSRGS